MGPLMYEETWSRQINQTIIRQYCIIHGVTGILALLCKTQLLWLPAVIYGQSLSPGPSRGERVP